MFRRSRHIAVNVPADQVEEAVQHYQAVFGLQEAGRSEDGVELRGPNFTIWVGTDEAPGILQEFVPENPEAARTTILEHGGTVTGESRFGFYVRDPFGMAYHVFLEEEPES